MRGVRWPAVVITLLLLASRSDLPSYAQPARADHLAAGLADLPSGAGAVAFTDWALIKQYRGVSNLTSASPADQRLKLMLSLSRDQAAFSAYGVDYFTSQAATWGWDSTDLVWEASIQGGKRSPAYVLRFRDTFDFAPLVARFVKRDFTKTEYHGVPIYSHQLDVVATWLLNDPVFSILNTAVLAAEHTLVLSSAQPAVRATLDTMQQHAPAFAADPAIRGAARALGTAASAMIFSRSSACALLDPVRLRASSSAPASLRADLHALAHVHPYAALAVGYRDEAKRPVGVIVMHYADAATARADLGARRTVASTGHSLAAATPYRDVFTVQRAYVVGSDIVFRLRFSHDRPMVLVEMVDSEDMLFAVC